MMIPAIDIPGSCVPGILQARTLEWVAISFSNAWKWKMKMKSLSRVWLLATPWTATYQAPPSMGFSRQESWSGVPLPSPKIVFTNLDNKKNYLIRWLYWRLWWCMLMFCKIQYSLKMYVCIYTLESPLNSQDLESSRRSNQSILKEISPEYSLEGLMLRLKL